MEFEITKEGILAVINASSSLSKDDILELARENFTADDLPPGEPYMLLMLEEEERIDGVDRAHWFVIPRVRIEEICVNHLEATGRSWD
jgi:hypothetical protein